MDEQKKPTLEELELMRQNAHLLIQLGQARVELVTIQLEAEKARSGKAASPKPR